MSKDKNLVSQRKRKFFEECILIFLIILGFSILVGANLASLSSEQQFVDLSLSFTQGKLYFLPSARWIDDAAPFLGKNYWPLGPFPSILLMPFVFIWGQAFQQGYLQFALIALIAFLLYKLARKLDCDQNASIWLTIAYIFSTCFIGVAMKPWSWQFGLIVANLLIIYALYEYFHKRRWWLIGICLGLDFTTRIHTILSLTFFALNLLTSKIAKKEKIRNLIYLGLPILLCAVFLLFYNFLRFHNIFETGENYLIPDNPILKINKSFGIWSLAHIPTNIYYFLLRGPVGVFAPDSHVLQFPFIKFDPWGMSILFTSPIFLWLAKMSLKNKDILLALITSCLLGAAMFGYYGIGFQQFGYRYALDFYPFIFLILLYTVRQSQIRLLKFVIFLSFMFNLYLWFLK